MGLRDRHTDDHRCGSSTATAAATAATATAAAASATSATTASATAAVAATTATAAGKHIAGLPNRGARPAQRGRECGRGREYRRPGRRPGPAGRHPDLLPQRPGLRHIRHQCSLRTQLLTKAPLDYEVRSGYRVTVRVHDGKSSSGGEYNGIDAYKDVTISLTNLDEAGEMSLSSTQPHVGTPLEAEVTDLDGSVSSETWRWEQLVGHERLERDSRGVLSLLRPGSSLDKSSYLRVTASYTDGQGAGKSASVGFGRRRGGQHRSQVPDAGARR